MIKIIYFIWYHIELASTIMLFFSLVLGMARFIDIYFKIF